jgi:hypothetical protein
VGLPWAHNSIALLLAPYVHYPTPLPALPAHLWSIFFWEWKEWEWKEWEFFMMFEAIMEWYGPLSNGVKHYLICLILSQWCYALFVHHA